MTRISAPLARRFGRCERGATAIEFALLAPLLLLLFAVCIELGRAYQSHRMFENAVSGFARTVASYPEYDSTVRTVAPLVGAALLPPGGMSRFHLQVTSYVKDQNVMKQVFTHTLVGQNPAGALSTALTAANYEQGEAVVYLVAAYDYRPLFSILPGVRFSKTQAINPFFARTHVWNANQSSDKYVN